MAAATPASARSVSRQTRPPTQTNNSTKSRSEYVEKLAATCGIPAAVEDIISSAYAAAAYCRERGFTRVYCVGQRGLVDELVAVGATPLGLDDGHRPFAFGSLRPADLDPAVQAVVVGFDGAASYYKLNMAAAYLRSSPSVTFVATNRDATYPDAHMIVSGGGTLVAAVATGAGREPDVVAGKPSVALLDIIEAAGALDRARTCMVGDRLDTDIAFGNAGRLGSTLLVLTGVTSAADAAAVPPGDVRRPSHVLVSFGELHTVVAEARRGLAASAGSAAK